MGKFWVPLVSISLGRSFPILGWIFYGLTPSKNPKVQAEQTGNKNIGSTKSAIFSITEMDQICMGDFALAK